MNKRNKVTGIDYWNFQDFWKCPWARPFIVIFVIATMVGLGVLLTDGSSTVVLISIGAAALSSLSVGLASWLYYRTHDRDYEEQKSE